jgi:uncharacterized repeat protein (TIGR03803 family)
MAIQSWPPWGGPTGWRKRGCGGGRRYWTENQILGLTFAEASWCPSAALRNPLPLPSLHDTKAANLANGWRLNQRRIIVAYTAQEQASKPYLRAALSTLVLVVLLVLAMVTTQSMQAQTFTVLYSFTNSDGAFPNAGVVRDAAGVVYGTTIAGGDLTCNDGFGCGVVFRLDTTGKETVLHSFAGGKRDGAFPFAGVILDSKGNLYGATELGGSSDHGIVFKLDTTGTLTVLHSFEGGKRDGCYPAGGLIRDKSANLYGTTEACGSFGYGTVFKLSMAGKETVLHSFAGNASDGAYPFLTNLLMDKTGNLYGIAQQGGSSDEGVVYKLSRNKTLTVLHSFAGGTADGCYALGAPAMDDDGNVFGATEVCGSSGEGIVWKVNKEGTETVLHSFAGGSSDGGFPFAGVALDPKGNLYGDTQDGGASGLGTVYELSKSGTLTLLHSFVSSDGSYPVDNLLRDASGNLYGTALQGGSGGYGTVWKLTP